MTQWDSYWNEAPRKFDEREFLKQVGKTVQGMPIRADQLDQIVAEIVGKIAVRASDTVLDLCCGNGLLTRRVSGHCARMAGVDFSAVLIDVARKHQQTGTIQYFCRSVLDPALVRELEEFQFTKAYMYEALQHFAVGDLLPLLGILKALLPAKGEFLIASVPDLQRIWSFYDTPERQAEYRRRVEDGTEAMGTWWSQETIRDVAGQAGFDARFLGQDARLHTAHYRFDAVLSRL